MDSKQQILKIKIGDKFEASAVGGYAITILLVMVLLIIAFYVFI